MNINRNTAKLPELALMLDSEKYGPLTNLERERIYKAFTRVDAILPIGGLGAMITTDTIHEYTKYKIRLISGGSYNSYPFTEEGLNDANNAAASGDVVEIPAGTITITAKITIIAGVKWMGQGKDKTILIHNGNLEDVLWTEYGTHLDNFSLSFTTSYEGHAFAINGSGGISEGNGGGSIFTNLRVYFFCNQGSSGTTGMAGIKSELYYNENHAVVAMDNVEVYGENISAGINYPDYFEAVELDWDYGVTDALHATVIMRDCTFAIYSDYGYPQMEAAYIDNYNDYLFLSVENCTFSCLTDQPFSGNSLIAVEGGCYRYGGDYDVTGALPSLVQFVGCEMYCITLDQPRDCYGIYYGGGDFRDCLSFTWQADASAGTGNWYTLGTLPEYNETYRDCTMIGISPGGGNYRIGLYASYASKEYYYNCKFYGDDWDIKLDGSNPAIYLYGCQYDPAKVDLAGSVTNTITHMTGDRAGLGTDQTFTGDNVFEGDLDVEHIDFNLTYAEGVHQEGRLHWNSDDNTLELGMTGGDVKLQVGQEILLRATNDQGAQIDNGQAVYVSGGTGNVPYVKLASNASIATRNAIGLATENMADGQKGYVTSYGLVRDIDMSAFAIGQVAWLGVDGALTPTRPTSPTYQTVMGVCIRSHASEGIIFVTVDAVQRLQGLTDVEITSIADEDMVMWDGGDSRFENVPLGRHIHYWNGSMVEQIKFTVTSNGTVITGNLVNGSDDTEDLTMRFSTGWFTLDATPAATVTITAGLDTAPQESYIYVPISTKVLTASTSDWPSEEHIKVASVSCFSAATTQTNGALKNANWNDHTGLTKDKLGHSLHYGERLRQLFGCWASGVASTIDITTNVGTPDNVDLAVTAGKVYQLHKQDFNAIDTGDGGDIHVVNHPTTPYQLITDLNTQLLDANGDSMSGDYFTLVFWGINNSNTEDDHIMCNLPTGSYNNLSSALADSLGYSVYAIPDAYKNTGFLIGQYTFGHSVSGGGTWTEENYIDLRGIQPNTSAGSIVGSSGVTTFLALTDTPVGFTAAAGQAAIVNSGETALEFIDALTAAEVLDLTDAGESALHYHDTDRDRANHTGTQVAATISDFDTEVGNHVDVAANTLARHDAVTVLDGTTIDFTLAGQQITAETIDGAIDHDALLNFTADEHFLQSAISIPFVQLTDTPANFTAAAGMVLAVNSTPDAVEFAEELVITAGVEVVINDGSEDVDFRVESDTYTHALFVQGSDGKVGVGTDTPVNKLTLYSDTPDECFLQLGNATTGVASGEGFILGLNYQEQALIMNYEDEDMLIGSYSLTRITIAETEIVFNGSGADYDFRVESDTYTHALFVQGSDGMVGIGNDTPINKLSVYENSSGRSFVHIGNSTTGITASDGLVVGFNDAETAYIWNYENSALAFGTNNQTVLTLWPTEAVVNEGSLDYDFRVESDNAAFGIFLQGSDGKVGFGTGTLVHKMTVYEPSSSAALIHIGNSITTILTSNGMVVGFSSAEEAYLWNYENSPLYLGVNGSLRMTIGVSEIAVNDSGLDLDFRVESTNDANALFVNGATGEVSSSIELTTDGFFNIGPPSSLTISSGAVTATGSSNRIYTEGGAATDNLDTINGSVDGRILVLRIYAYGKTVVVRDTGGGTGNIRLNGAADFTMTSTNDTLTLMGFASGYWAEIGRCNY